MAYMNGGVDATTNIMDEYAESELLTDYIEWTKSNLEVAEDNQAIIIFETLRDDLRDDLQVIQGDVEWIRFEEPKEGKWTLKEPEPWLFEDKDFDWLDEYEEGERGRTDWYDH